MDQAEVPTRGGQGRQLGPQLGQPGAGRDGAGRQEGVGLGQIGALVPAVAQALGVLGIAQRVVGRGQVQDLARLPVESYEDIQRLMAVGEKTRTVAATE